MNSHYLSSAEYGFSNEDQQSSAIKLNLLVKTTRVLILNEILHLPIAQVVENSVGPNASFSCVEKSIFSSCDVDCSSNPVLDFRLQKIPEVENVYSSRVFWFYVFLVLVTWIAFAVVTSVADALCFQTLGVVCKKNVCIYVCRFLEF